MWLIIGRKLTRYAELRYKAWGQTRYTYGTTPTQRRYTGQLEAEAGLYFYNARWFDPALGRFAQADTVIPDPGNPLAWDRYAYVYNNPQKYTDPSSHEICDEEGNCFDQGTRTNKRGLAMGKPKNSMPQYFSVSSPSYNPKLLEKNLQETLAFVDFMGRIAFEPYDWYRIGVDCLNQQCNGWDFLGLLPLLPAGITKYGDEIAGGFIRAVPLDQVGTSQAFKLRKGEDGISVFFGVSSSDVLAELPGGRVPNTTVTIPGSGLPPGTKILVTAAPDLSKYLSDAHRILVRPEG
jgi:RHS repeat-associated protein